MNRIDNTTKTESGESRWVRINSTIKSFQGLFQKILQFQKQILAKLEHIYGLRIVQKLARPISMEIKQQIIKQLKKNTDYINERMLTMENQFDLYYLTCQKQIHKNEKAKKKVEMTIHAKLCFFNIRKKYVETFVHSSFAHFNKVTDVFQLKHDIKFIDADKWLSKCILKIEKGIENQQNLSCC